VSEAGFRARSLLFVPGDSERKLERSALSEADLLLIDLEDAVAPERKPEARRLTAAYLAGRETRTKPLWIRMNPLSTPDALPDLVATVRARPDGYLVPKVRGAEDLRVLDNYLTALEAEAGLLLGGIKLMIVSTETPQGLFATGGYAEAPRLVAMTWGAEDIATALGASTNRDEAGEYEFTYRLARTLCLAGAAAAGIAAIETIHGDYKDPEGLRRIATTARKAGFRGMIAIHPDQCPVINAAFTPDEAELAQARRIVEAFAAKPGAGTVGLDGQMLDAPHLKRAEAVLAMAGAR
jgi:citrate lyase subunit beta/citryl-CoA lyase